jgi:flagellar biogenesis protein FliO
VSPYAGYLVETFVTLVVVCVLAGLILWGAKRAGLGQGRGPVELCGHLQLEPRRAVYLVKVLDTVYVVAAGEGGLIKLGELPAKSLPTTPERRVPPFAEVLARVLGKAARPR